MGKHMLAYIPEDLIRQRSYLIWVREGCPHGNALNHWLRAQAEVEAEQAAEAQLGTSPPLRKPLAFVMPRVPISTPPKRSVSVRVTLERPASVAR